MHPCVILSSEIILCEVCCWSVSIIVPLEDLNKELHVMCACMHACMHMHLYYTYIVTLYGYPVVTYDRYL